MQLKAILFSICTVLISLIGQSSQALTLSIDPFVITPVSLTLTTNTTDTNDANSDPTNPPTMVDTALNTITGTNDVVRQAKVNSKIVVNPDTLFDGNVYAGFRWGFYSTGLANRISTDPSTWFTEFGIQTRDWVIQYAGFGGLGTSLSVPYSGLTFTFDGTAAGELSFEGQLNILGQVMPISNTGIALNFDSFNPTGIIVAADATKFAAPVYLDYPIGNTPFTVSGTLLYQVSAKSSVVLPTIMQIVPEDLNGRTGGLFEVGITTLPLCTQNTLINSVCAPVPAPSPLPLLGVGAAFGFSRKLRKRIKISNTPEVISAIG